MASEIGAFCHIFRDIDVFSAVPEAAFLGVTLGKALKMSKHSKYIIGIRIPYCECPRVWPPM